jgi:hypothetical protein
MCDHDPGCEEYPSVNHRNHWNGTGTWPNEHWIDPEQRRAQEAAEKARLRREGQQAKAAARRAQRATERAMKPSTMNARHDDEVQLAGGRDALPNSGTNRRVVYDVLYAAGEHGCTFDEIEIVIGDPVKFNYSTIGPRVRELRGADDNPILVQETDRTRTARSGSEQRVYVALPLRTEENTNGQRSHRHRSNAV